jgi:transcriptional regulator with XRE-family HTH domain
MQTTMVRRRVRRKTPDVDTRIGERIQQRRIGLEILQADLAAEIGASVGVLSRIEQGRQTITAERLSVLARRLGVSADYLLGLTGE